MIEIVLIVEKEGIEEKIEARVVDNNTVDLGVGIVPFTELGIWTQALGLGKLKGIKFKRLHEARKG